MLESYSSSTMLPALMLLFLAGTCCSFRLPIIEPPNFPWGGYGQGIPSDNHDLPDIPGALMKGIKSILNGPFNLDFTNERGYWKIHHEPARHDKVGFPRPNGPFPNKPFGPDYFIPPSGPIPNFGRIPSFGSIPSSGPIPNFGRIPSSGPPHVFDPDSLGGGLVVDDDSEPDQTNRPPILIDNGGLVIDDDSEPDQTNGPPVLIDNGGLVIDDDSEDPVVGGSTQTPMDSGEVIEEDFEAAGEGE